MALLDPAHPSVSQTSQEFWSDEIKNCRILLSDVNRRIHELEIESYTVDTGQSSQTAKRSSLQDLYNFRAKLIDEISGMEDLIGDGDSDTISSQCIQVVPF